MMNKRLGCSNAYREFWPSLWAKMLTATLLLSFQNKGQWSVNDCLSCIMVNQSAMWPVLSIYKVLTIVIDYNAHEHVVAAFNPTLVATVREAVLGFSLAYVSLKQSNSWCIDDYN
jgi:hypothetical protein